MALFVSVLVLFWCRVTLPGVDYYTGIIVRPDSKIKDAVQVRFPNDYPEWYWFPVTEVQTWLTKYGPFDDGECGSYPRRLFEFPGEGSLTHAMMSSLVSRCIIRR